MLPNIRDMFASCDIATLFPSEKSMVFKNIFGTNSSQWLNRLFNEQRRKFFGIAAGVGVGLLGMHYTFVRPMAQQMNLMRGEMTVMQERMAELNGARGSVEKTNDLLAGLSTQEETFTHARNSLDRIRNFREEFEQEARRTSTAVAALEGIHNVQTNLIQEGVDTQAALQSVDKMATLQSRIDGIGAGVDGRLNELAKADNALKQLAELKAGLVDQEARIAEAKEQLVAFDSLRADLVASAETISQAMESADSLIALKDQLAAGGENAVAAKVHADGLLNLHDTLADGESLRLDDARHNLVNLLNMRSELNETTDTVVAAAENLDLLVEFQTELNTRIEEVTGLRRDLHEITMLRDTVARVSETLAPLTEMTDLKRMSDEDRREFARKILQRRTAAKPNENLFSEVPAISSAPIERSVDTHAVDVPVPPPADAE